MAISNKAALVNAVNEIGRPVVAMDAKYYAETRYNRFDISNAHSALKQAAVDDGSVVRIDRPDGADRKRWAGIAYAPKGRAWEWSDVLDAPPWA